jgi:hypothetical protein
VEDATLWAIFGECRQHGLIGAREGELTADLRSVVRVRLVEVPDVRAGVLGETVVLGYDGNEPDQGGDEAGDRMPQSPRPPMKPAYARRPVPPSDSPK